MPRTFVVQTNTFAFFPENSQPAWIGASDIIKEGVFMWINGELVQDMTSSTSTSSNCLAMSRYGIDDENCGIEYQLICQITVS